MLQPFKLLIKSNGKWNKNVVVCTLWIVVILAVVLAQEPVDPPVYTSEQVNEAGDYSKSPAVSLNIWASVAQWLRLRIRGAESITEKWDEVTGGGTLSNVAVDKVLSTYVSIAVFVGICLIFGVIFLILAPLSLLSGDLCRSYKRPDSQTPSQSLNQSNHDGDWLYKIAISSKKRSLGSVTLWVFLIIIVLLLVANSVFMILANSAVTSQVAATGSMAATSISQAQNDTTVLGPTVDATFTNNRAQIIANVTTVFTGYIYGVLQLPQLSWALPSWNNIVSVATTADIEGAELNANITSLNSAITVWETNTGTARSVIDPVVVRAVALNDVQVDARGNYELSSDLGYVITSSSPNIIIPLAFADLLSATSTTVPVIVTVLNDTFDQIVTDTTTLIDNGVSSAITDFDTNSYPALQSEFVQLTTSLGTEANNSVENAKEPLATAYAAAIYYDNLRSIATLAVNGVLAFVAILILMSLLRRSVRLHVCGRLLGLFLVAIIMLLCPILFLLTLVGDELCIEISNERRGENLLNVAESTGIVTVDAQLQSYIDAGFEAYQDCSEPGQSGYLQVAIATGLFNLTAALGNINLPLTVPTVSITPTIPFPPAIPTIDDPSSAVPNVLAAVMSSQASQLADTATNLQASDITFTSSDPAVRNAQLEDFRTVINGVSSSYAGLGGGSNQDVNSANSAGSDVVALVDPTNTAINDFSAALTTTSDTANTEISNIQTALDGKTQELTDGIPGFTTTTMNNLVTNITLTPEQQNFNCSWVPKHAQAYDTVLCKGVISSLDVLWLNTFLLAVLMFIGMSLTSIMINQQWAWAK